jgi:hypothetical protein
LEREMAEKKRLESGMETIMSSIKGKQQLESPEASADLSEGGMSGAQTARRSQRRTATPSSPWSVKLPDVLMDDGDDVDAGDALDGISRRLVFGKSDAGDRVPAGASAGAGAGGGGGGRVMDTPTSSISSSATMSASHARRNSNKKRTVVPSPEEFAEVMEVMTAHASAIASASPSSSVRDTGSGHNALECDGPDIILLPRVAAQGDASTRRRDAMAARATTIATSVVLILLVGAVIYHPAALLEAAAALSAPSASPWSFELAKASLNDLASSNSSLSGLSLLPRLLSSLSPSTSSSSSSSSSAHPGTDASGGSSERAKRTAQGEVQSQARDNRKLNSQANDSRRAPAVDADASAPKARSKQTRKETPRAAGEARADAAHAGEQARVQRADKFVGSKVKPRASSDGQRAQGVRSSRRGGASSTVVPSPGIRARIMSVVSIAVEAVKRAAIVFAILILVDHLIFV